MRLLLLEEDSALGGTLQESLRRAGFAVNWVREAKACALTLQTEAYDLLVADYRLLQPTPAKFLHQVREGGSTIPILVYGERGNPAQRIIALDGGADDFLEQPFGIDELHAVIRALLRRHAGRSLPTIEHGPLTLDPASRSATLSGEPLELSPREFAILEVLAENAGRVASKPRLEEALYAWGEEVESNAVEVHVHRLRRKLGPGFIRTVRGIGYVMDKPRERAAMPAPTAAAAAIPSGNHPEALLVALREIYSRLELAVEGQRNFAEDVSRELRRPLCALKAQAELALREPYDEKHEQALLAIIQSADQACHLLEVLLTLARLDTPAQPEINRPVDLCKICEKALGEIVPTAAEHGVELSLATHCHGQVWGRPDMLDLLVRNLAETAVRCGVAGSQVEFSVQEANHAISLRLRTQAPPYAASGTPPGEEPASQTTAMATATLSDAWPQRREGLSLALVRRIAFLHGAQLHMSAEHGRLEVAVDFPQSMEARGFNWLI